MILINVFKTLKNNAGYTEHIYSNMILLTIDL